MFYRRVAASISLLLALILAIAVGVMEQATCRAATGCGWRIFFVAMAVAVPLITLTAWLWGRWHEQKTAGVTRRLEREYKQQVALVDLERQRLDTVLNQMVDGVVLIDDAGRVQYLNPAAAQVLNTSPAEALNQQFIGVAYHHQLIELWQKSQVDHVGRTMVLEIERQGLFVQVIFSPLQFADQEGTLVILQDLTRIRRLETVRRDFISNVSHELLTPISALRALIETIQDGAIEEPPVAQRFLNRALSEIDSVAQIVTELLTLSRIESGQVALRLKPISIEELIERPLEQASLPAERQGIELKVKIDPALPLVLADAEQIWQVVGNILHNALKFTPEKGRITFRARQVSDSDESVQIEITDTGIGIPPEDLPRIFERFYKANRSRHREHAGGTGLGLSIAKHIVHAHGGQIWAKSQMGKGTTFYFTLPIAAEKFSDPGINQAADYSSAPAVF